MYACTKMEEKICAKNQKIPVRMERMVIVGKTLEIILRLIRERYGSAASFEKAAGLRPGTVYDWKRSKSGSYYKMLPELACFFAVSTDYLLPGNENRQEDIQSAAEQKRVMDFMGEDMVIQVTPEQKKKLLKLMKAAFEEGVAYDQSLFKWKIGDSSEE